MRTPRSSRFAGLGLALSFTALLAACGSMPGGGMAYSQAGLPASIQVPAGNRVALETVGKGEILYECRDKAGMPGELEWTFVGPKAVLNDRSGKQRGL